MPQDKLRDKSGSQKTFTDKAINDTGKKPNLIISGLCYMKLI